MGIFASGSYGYLYLSDCFIEPVFIHKSPFVSTSNDRPQFASSQMYLFRIYCLLKNKQVEKCSSKRLIKPQLHPYFGVFPPSELPFSPEWIQIKPNVHVDQIIITRAFSIYFSGWFSLSLQLCSNTSAPQRPEGFLAGCIMLNPVTCL